jgi:hypothetical protein
MDAVVVVVVSFLLIFIRQGRRRATAVIAITKRPETQQQQQQQQQKVVHVLRWLVRFFLYSRPVESFEEVARSDYKERGDGYKGKKESKGIAAS